MTLIDGERIITAQLYDDEHEEFTEKKMSIIDYINAYTEEGVTTADDVLDKLRAEVCDIDDNIVLNPDSLYERKVYVRLIEVVDIIDKYTAESEGKE